MSFIVAAAIGAGGVIGGSIISSRAAGKAADKQVEAANYAADLQYKGQTEALNLQREMWEQQQANYAPWLAGGQGALQTLLQRMGLGTLTPTTTTIPAAEDPYAQQRADLLGKITTLQQTEYGPDAMITPEIKAGMIADLQSQLDRLPPAPQATTKTTYDLVPGSDGSYGVGGDLMKPFGMEDFQADPGYQFRVSEGERALERTAAAKGGALSGGAVRSALRYNSGLASQEYANAFDRYNINQSNAYNRLANVAGLGQTAVNQLGQAGRQYADTAGNIFLNTANNVGNLAQNAANARASGYINSANAWNNAISGVGNNIMNTILLNQLLSNPASYPTYGTAAATGIPRITPPLFGG